MGGGSLKVESKFALDRVLLFGGLLVTVLLSFGGCGSDKKEENKSNSPSDPRYSVAAASEAELPECNESRRQALGYVTSSASLFACNGQTWVPVPLPKGDKGETGATGAKGADGPPGQKGDAGAPGQDATATGAAVVATTTCTQSITSPAAKTYAVSFTRDYFDTGVVRTTFRVNHGATVSHSTVTIGNLSGKQTSGCLSGACHYAELEVGVYSLVITTKANDPTDSVYYRALIDQTYWSVEALMSCTTAAP